MAVFVRLLRALVPPTIVAAFTIALFDVVVRAFVSDPSVTELWPTVGSVAVLTCTYVWCVLPALVIALLPVAIVGRVFGLEAGSPAELVEKVVGPTPQSRLRGWLTLLAIPVLGVLASIGFNELSLQVYLPNVFRAVANLVVWTLGIVVVIVIHRLAVRRWPELAVPHVPLLIVVTVWAYAVADRWWEYLSRETLAIPFAIVVGLATVTIVRACSQDLVRRATDAAAGIVFLLVIGLTVAFPTGEVLSAAAFRPLFGAASLELVRAATDIDGDNESHLFGGADCAPFDGARRPTAMEIVGNGIDDNCSGGDLASFDVAPPAPARWSAKRPRPVVLITVDTLRADHLGLEIRGKRLTPVIDALASRGIDFRRAYSASTHTDEAVPAIGTGMYPKDWHRYGVYFGVEPTLPEILGSAGYQTIAVTSFPWIKKHMVHGLEIVDNTPGEEARRRENLIPDERVTDTALRYLDQRDERPVFLWVHYYGPHGPNRPIAKLRPTFGADGYRHAVHETDRQVGRLLQGLEQRGLLSDALIVLTSDHGEGLGQHNIRTHVWGMWESIVRVPLIVRMPGAGRSTREEVVSTVDIAPTVYDALDVRPMPVRDGRSLLEPRDGPVFVEVEYRTDPLGTAVVDGDWKLIHDSVRDAYFLSRPTDDREDATNLMNEHPEVFDRLREQLERRGDEAFNDLRLERKKAMWESRAEWVPDVLELGGDELETSE